MTNELERGNIRFLKFDVTEDLYDLLTKLTQSTGNNAGQVVRDALVLLDVAVDAVLEGGYVTVNYPIPGSVENKSVTVTGFMRGYDHE